MAGPKITSNTLLFLVIFFVLLAVGLSCAWTKKFNTSPKETMMRASTSGPEPPDGTLEMIESPDGADSFEMVGDYDGVFEEGFGMGPGLYGSGRHTSEMLG